MFFIKKRSLAPLLARMGPKPFTEFTLSPKTSKMTSGGDRICCTSLAMLRRSPGELSVKLHHEDFGDAN